MGDREILFWESVIFVDESKFYSFGSDGRISVCRKFNEVLNPKYLLPIAKNGGGGIMKLGCFAISGMGNLELYFPSYFIENKMDECKYINRVKENLKI